MLGPIVRPSCGVCQAIVLGARWARHKGGDAVAKTDNEQPGGELDRAVRVGQLLDLYGPLLTDRQREFVTLHYLEDLSFGEIAKEFGISRQAVHDAVKHAENSLQDYDEKLRLTPEQVAARVAASAANASANGADSDGGAASAAAATAALPAEALAPAIERLEATLAEMRQSGGVIYNGDAMARQLAEAIAMLRRAAGEQG